jgi:hypothetical protein
MEFPGQPVNFTYIGTVANILHGRKEDNQLKLDVVNEYILDADSVPNTFICHLWCHPDDEVGLHNYLRIIFNVIGPAGSCTDQSFYHHSHSTKASENSHCRAIQQRQPSSRLSRSSAEGG